MTSSGQVVEGVKLVSDTGKSLERIVTEASETSSVVSKIVAANREQAVSLKELSAATQQLDQITQQNAAMVEESTAASHSLMQETERLMSLVGKFRIGGGADPIRSELERVAPHVFSNRPSEQKMAHG